MTIRKEVTLCSIYLSLLYRRQSAAQHSIALQGDVNECGRSCGVQYAAHAGAVHDESEVSVAGLQDGEAALLEVRLQSHLVLHSDKEHSPVVL